MDSSKENDDIPVVSVNDIQNEAKKKMDPIEWLHLEEGAGTGQTRRNNMAAFKSYTFLPRVLRGVNNATTRTTILGREVACPIGIAPTGMQRRVHPEGENATARAAVEREVIGAFSIASSCSMEEIATAAPSGMLWQQIDLLKDREVVLDLIQRAERQGFTALVVSVDHDHGLSVRYARLKYKPKRIPGLKLANFPSERPLPEKYSTNNPGQSWDDLAWVINMTSLPVVVKGILRPEDAVTAVDLGARAIWVSNHGGLNLDSLPASIDALKDIVEAVEGRAEVYMDGGIRTGIDVAKAIALGARAVFIGRPVWYGLAYNGQKGVEMILEILQQEFFSNMVLLGADNPGKLDSSLISKL